MWLRIEYDKPKDCSSFRGWFYSSWRFVNLSDKKGRKGDIEVGFRVLGLSVIRFFNRKTPVF